jgi:hypothetical protein
MDNEMYITDESDDDNQKPPSAILTRRGKTHLITLGDKQFEIVDPVLVMQLETLIKKLENRISALEHELVQTKARLGRTDRKINETVMELNNKVDYE